jgi:ribosomal protein S12 methylthiotransferase
VQDPITRDARDDLVGRAVDVLLDGFDDASGTAVGRTHREAPEIDGVVRVDGADFARPGAVVRVEVTAAFGPDLEAKAVRP